MKKITLLMFGLLGALLAACSSGDRVRNVDARAFGKAIGTDRVWLLDVRTPEEYASGHIAGAMNMDVLGAGFRHAAESRLGKDREVWVYCRSGKRSLTAAAILSKAGYRVVNLRGGIMEWEQAGLPLIGGEGK